MWPSRCHTPTPGLCEARGHSSISSLGPPPDSGDVSLPICLSGRPGLTWLEEAGGRGAKGNPGGTGLVPTVAPRRPRVQLRPVQALGAGGMVSDSVQGWRRGTLLGGRVSGQSRGQEPGGEPHRANVRTMRLGWSHWAQETCPRKRGATCCHEGWAWPGSFPDPSGLLAPSALVRHEGPGAAGADCNRPERPKAGGVWAGLGVPT